MPDPAPNTIEGIKAQMTALQERLRELDAKLDEEARTATAAEQQQIDAWLDTFDSLEAMLKRKERLAAQDETLAGRSAGRAAAANQPAAPGNALSVRGGLDPLQPLSGAPDGPTHGFRNMGEFAVAVVRAARPGITRDQIDERLIRNQPSELSQTGVPEQGGHAVPPDFRSAILTAVQGDDSLLPQTDQWETAYNTITVPWDESTPWGGSGVRAYWTAEGSPITQSSVDLKQQAIPLHKIGCLVPVTEELLEDAPGINSHIRQHAPRAITYEVNDAVFKGDGTGKPLGWLNSAAAIEVAPDAGTGSGEFNLLDAFAMYTRIPARIRRSARWYMSQDLEPQLLNLEFVTRNVAGSENVSGVPMFIPPGRVADAPNGAILGRPIEYLENANQPGTVGDVVFCSPDWYMTATKVGGGLREDVSMHLWFDHDIQALRFILRVGGLNWLQAPITSANGTTRSNIITLGARP